MSVSKRAWTTPSGEEREAWVCRCTDASGNRRLKTFPLKKAALAFAATTSVEVRQGVHVADSASSTVTQAGELWLATIQDAGREQSTVDQYRQHLRLHIGPRIGATKLSALMLPAVRSFEDELRRDGRSSAMIRKIMVSLGSMLADAQERGLVGRNVIREMRGGRKRGTARRHEARHKGRLKVGVDIPTREEAKAIVNAAAGRWRPLLLMAIFAGLRASELRGLRWSDVDLDRREVKVQQRADRYNVIGPPKSEAGERTVPVPPLVVNALREWTLACPRRDTGKKDAAGEPIKELHLVFPNGAGKVESLANIINRGLVPTQVTAGVSAPKLNKAGEAMVDKAGAPILTGRYSGMHALRHFFASWLINRVQDGGLGLPPKVVQERMGHASIAITMDVYGHLFPRGDDADELAAAERAFLS